MVPKFLIPFGVALCLHSPSLAPAQTSPTTDPVGFTTTSCLARSDTYVSIPFTRPSVFTGTVLSAGSNVLTFIGTPVWMYNQFVYVLISQSETYMVFIGY